MKRFTETLKWQDSWWRKLPSNSKLLFYYMVDLCDSAGVIELDLELVSIDIGTQLTLQDVKRLGDRVEAMGGGKYLVTGFITFQCPNRLEPNHAPHKPILRLIEKYGLVKVGDRYTSRRVEASNTQSSPSPEPQHTLNRGSESLQETEKETETEKEGGGCKEGGAPEPPAKSEHEVAVELIQHLNKAASRSFVPVANTLKLVRARLSEVKGDADGIRKMIDRQVALWGSDPGMREYLRPETLFGASKFHSYFGSKDAPVSVPPPPRPSFTPPSEADLD